MPVAIRQIVSTDEFERYPRIQRNVRKSRIGRFPTGQFHGRGKTLLNFFVQTFYTHNRPIRHPTTSLETVFIDHRVSAKIRCQNRKPGRPWYKIRNPRPSANLSRFIQSSRKLSSANVENADVQEQLTCELRRAEFSRSW